MYKIKGTVRVNSSNPTAKITIPKQRYNFKNVKDSVVFLTQKVLISENFSIVSYTLEMCKSPLQRNHIYETNQFKSHHTSTKGFKGSACKSSVLPYLHRGSFDITLTIPLKMKKENFLFFGVFFLYFTFFLFSFLNFVFLTLIFIFILFQTSVISFLFI